MEGREEIAKLRAVYGVLLDPDAAPADRAIEVDSARPPSFQEMRSTIARELDKASGAHGVEIRADGLRLGVSTRKMLDRLAGSAGGEPGTSLSTGDRASLEGESTQYCALQYACTVAGCQREAFRSFHDVRCLPSCTDHHVLMELRGWI
jgi:hypothetical protein